MKRFFSAVGLCVCLLVSGVFLFSPSMEAQDNVLESLLSLPAPPPVNPFFEGSRQNRPENFFSKKNPPSDDASIEDLMAYWQAQSQFDAEYTYTIKPSAKSLERLRAEIEKNPEQLGDYLNVLAETPDSADFVKRLYERELNDGNLGEDWRETVKEWLTMNSPYFIKDLVEMAQQAGDSGEYVSNQSELRALARVDWDRARPILDRLINDSSQPISQTLARWVYYEHALREGDIGDIDRYRKLLQETVENKNEKPGNRDLAMDALVEGGDFPGRDDWYYSLLSDETLFDLQVNGENYTSLTTLLNHSPADKYLEKMLELIRSDNQTIRNVAARNLGTLLDEKNPEVIRALLPWLENPNWAKEVDDERQALVTALVSVEMPESVPGLIAVLNEKGKEVTVSQYSNTNTMSNTMSNTSVPTIVTNSSPYLSSNALPSREVGSYPYRSLAIGALEKQKDARAAEPLRLILPQVEEYERPNIVRAMLASNAFSVPEQIEALEAVAKSSYQSYPNSNTNATLFNTMPMNMPAYNAVPNIKPVISSSNMIIPKPVLANTTRRVEVMTVLSNTSVNGNYSTMSQPYNPNDIKITLGNQIINNAEPTNELVIGLIDRIERLEEKDKQTAQALRRYMTNWRGAAINSLMLRDLKNGKAGIDSIVQLLIVRKELLEKQTDEIYDARGAGNAIASGISACLLDDKAQYEAILSGENIESKIAVLGCARIIRAELPIPAVAEYLKDANKMLALAAESYLESEDSPAARAIVLSLHPNEAKILGAKTFFDGEDFRSNYLAQLFASVNNAFSADSAYFLFENSSEDYQYILDTETSLQKEVKENEKLLGIYAFDKNYIRIYKDQAVYSWEENAARYHERVLTTEEFDNVKNYLASHGVDELPPFLSFSEDEYMEKELLMLGRQGGRRVFMKAQRLPPFFAELTAMFEELRRAPAKLHYQLEKDVAGLEILFTDERLQAQTVWKSGDDLRVLIDDTARRKRIDKEIDAQEITDANKEDIDYEKQEQINRKRRETREFENFSWHKLANNKLADFASQPPQVEFIPARDNLAAQAQTGQWKARTATFEIRASEDGLYKLSRGALTKIKSGNYDKPVVTPNGRWAVVRKLNEDQEPELVRVNLLTNREYKMEKFENYQALEAVSFIASLNKVLLLAGYYDDDEGEGAGTFYLLDPETGVLQEVENEVRPLAQQSFRPLQPTGVAGEYWAAIHEWETNTTEVGIYREKTLSFKPLLKIPKIKFESMNMWIDAGRVYFIFEGHVLSLPMPKG
ncbi:MAG: HEAT repeat domain-containing protein [Pyrinomonadaceae bacterium]